MPLFSSEKQGLSSNVDAAGRIFAEHGDFIRGVIASQIRDPNTVEDIFQGFFVSLATRALPPVINRNYLYQAIIHDIIDSKRRNFRYHSALQRNREVDPSDLNRTDDPIRQSINREETSRMFELIEQRLHPSESEAIVLRYKHEMSVEDAAQRMGVESKTLSRYVAVGLRKIRDFLQKTEGVGHDRT
jgi:RNA polymerase sigma factor (sigma-70 family)